MPFDPGQAARLNLWRMASSIRDDVNAHDKSPLAKAYDRIVERRNARQEPFFDPSRNDLEELWNSLKLDRRIEKIKKVTSDSSLDTQNSLGCEADSLRRALRDASQKPEKKLEKKIVEKPVKNEPKEKKSKDKSAVDLKQAERQKNLKAWQGSHFFLVYEAFEEQFKGTGKKNYLKVLADSAPDVTYHGYELKK